MLFYKIPASLTVQSIQYFHTAFTKIPECVSVLKSPPIKNSMMIHNDDTQIYLKKECLYPTKESLWDTIYNKKKRVLKTRRWEI